MSSSLGSLPFTQKRRKRRRRQDKPAIAARLVLDDHVKGDVGILSEDVFEDLFPQLKQLPEDEDQNPIAPDVLHVAIAPWAPNSSPDETSWTVVPVTKSSALATSTVQFSPSSLALQNFAADLQRVAPSKLSTHSRSGIEILVLDVLALSLDTVFVSLEGELARRLEDGEGTYFRDHPAPHTRGKAPSSASAEDKLTTALRVALGYLHVVHAGDSFPLPLPPHPVTHVPPNPGKVTLCEPVSQGILSPLTKIILSRGRPPAKALRESAKIPPARTLNGMAEDDEDTATDQFYSAAEERDKADAQPHDLDSMTETESELSEAGDGELSDDSMDDMISLQAPMLPPTTASGVSTVQPGTPHTIGRGRKTNGISTPGSIFSNFTATTARPDRPRGRLFKAQGLMAPIPSDLLHPKPNVEDDEETRVYVDVRDLPKVGCFSGDWVRMEAAEEPPANGFGAFGLGSFGNGNNEEPGWRPVRIFGLPEGYSHRPVTRIPSSKHDERRMSFFESQIQKPSSPAAFVSPILLANIENSPFLRLAPLKRLAHGLKGMSSKLTYPPPARDVLIHGIKTPMTQDKATQTAIMGAIKSHFEKKLRVVVAGDIIAIPVDTQLGRTLQGSSANGEDITVDELVSLTASNATGERRPQYDDVAWFRVGHVQAAKPESQEPDQADDIWGAAACVDISITRVEQSGNITSRIPGISDSTWQYYHGLRDSPRREMETLMPTRLDPSQRYVSPLRRRFRELLAAATSAKAIHFKMPPLAIMLVSTQRNIGKAKVVKDACLDLGLHTFTMDAYDILNEAGGGSDTKAELYLKARADRAMSCGADCCALLIRHVEALTAERMASTFKEILADARVVIATTTEVDKVPDGMRGLFSHELEMSAPDEGEREGILRSIVDDRGILLDSEIDLGGIALKTAALVAGDLVDVVERAVVAQRSRLEQLAHRATSQDGKVTLRDIQVAGGSAARGLTKADFEVAVDAARKNFADAIGAPKIPNVTWDDVGGLGNVKEAVMETIQLPLERPELFARGMKKRSGILFYGPPGTGKTLLAKAIATEYSLNFFSVKGPELLNMYIGESEANVRRVFQRARDARPCVVFFDELDSVAPKRGNQGDSGGVMDRIVSQLLAELDGMSGGGDDAAGGVFVIGATNRPDLLDQALLRPGRFDKMLYLGVSDTHDKQLKIMEALTRKFTLHPTVSLPSVADRLPFTYTGADFYALCSDAMLKAVTRQAAAVDAKVRALNAARSTGGGQQQQQPLSTAAFFDHHATPEDVAVSVTEQDFLEAQRELVPSVSAGELAHYEHVRAAFEGAREKGGGSGVGSGNGHGHANGNGNGNGSVQSPPGMRTVSASSRGSAKGKGKAVAGGKGKGKAVAVNSDDEFDEDEDDEAYALNGRGNKGKGKAVASFHDTGSDDEGLYD